MLKKFKRGSGEFIAFAFVGSIMCMVIAYIGALLIYSCASSDVNQPMTEVTGLWKRPFGVTEAGS